MSRLIDAVAQLNHVRHLGTSMKSKIVDRWGHRLPRSLMLEVVTFLDAGMVAAMLSVNSVWHHLVHDERFCRLVYVKWFGECTSRDMDTFQFDRDTPWVQRLDVRVQTMLNWIHGTPSMETLSDMDKRNRMRWEWCLDGCKLHINHHRSVDNVIDLHRKRLETSCSNQLDLDAIRHVLRDPDLAVLYDDERKFPVVIRRKSTAQEIMRIGTPDHGRIDTIDCDPTSDLVRVQFYVHGEYYWHSYHALSGQRIASAALNTIHDSAAPTLSNLYDGNFYHLRGGSMDVICARTGKKMIQDAKVPDFNLDAITSRHLVFRGRTGYTELWNRHRLTCEHKFHMPYFLLDMSRRECFAMGYDDSMVWKGFHIDVNGRVRHLSLRWYDPDGIVVAFNGRWVVTTLHGGNGHVYDFMPRRAQERLMTKRRKIS